MCISFYGRATRKHGDLLIEVINKINKNSAKASSHLLAQKSQEPQSECGY